MERRNKSGIAGLIAGAICCGGPLLLIFIVSNVAFLWSLLRSGSFWAGTALLLGGIAFFLIIRRRRARQVRLPAMDSRPSPDPAREG